MSCGIKLGIADHKKGTTWDGMEMYVEEGDSDGVMLPKDFTSVSVICNFKSGMATVFSFKTSDGSITIPNPTDGKVFFTGGNIIDFPPCVYHFDVTFTLPNGVVEKIPTQSWKIYL